MRCHGWFALGCVGAAVLGLARGAAADTTLGVEWEKAISIGVHGTKTDPAGANRDSPNFPRRLLCTPGPHGSSGYPLVSVTYDRPWLLGKVSPRWSATLEIITQPILSKDAATWAKALTFITKFYQALASECQSSQIAVNTPASAAEAARWFCFATVDQLVKKMGDAVASTDCYAANDPHKKEFKKDEIGFLLGYEGNGFDFAATTPVPCRTDPCAPGTSKLASSAANNFAVQTNVPVKLSHLFTQDLSSFYMLAQHATPYQAAQLAKDVISKTPKLRDLTPDQKGFLVLYAIGINVHALWMFDGERYDGSRPTTLPITAIDSPLKGRFEVLPKMPVNKILASFTKPERDALLAAEGIGTGSKFCIPEQVIQEAELDDSSWDFMGESEKPAEAAPVKSMSAWCAETSAYWTTELGKGNDPANLVEITKPVDLAPVGADAKDNRMLLLEIRGAVAKLNMELRLSITDVLEKAGSVMTLQYLIDKKAAPSLPAFLQ